MSDAKQCDRCKKFFLESVSAAHRISEQSENLAVSASDASPKFGPPLKFKDLCSVCQEERENWLLGGKLKAKKEERRLWSQAARDAASVRMSARMAEKFGKKREEKTVEKTEKETLAVSGTSWSRDDDAKLRKLVNATPRLNMNIIAHELKRSVSACYMRAGLLGLSKRKPRLEPAEE